MPDNDQDAVLAEQEHHDHGEDAPPCDDPETGDVGDGSGEPEQDMAWLADPTQSVPGDRFARGVEEGD